MILKKTSLIENSHTLKLADLVVSTALTNSGIPGADALYNFSKLAIQSVKKELINRDEERIEKFHAHLLFDEHGINEKVVECSLDLADYHALLRSCLDDIENEKTGCYGNLTQAIALRKIPSNLKRHYILSLREMSWGQLDLLARVYVLNKYDIRPETGSSRLYAASILEKTKNYAHNIDVDILLNKGLTDKDTITPIGCMLIENCFPADLLKPEAYEYNIWLNAYYRIFMLGDTKHIQSSASIVHKHFRDIGFKGGMGPAEGSLDRLISDLRSKFFIIIYPSGHKIPTNRLENLIKTINKRPFIQVIITDDLDEHCDLILDGDAITTSHADLNENLNRLEEKLAELHKNLRSESDIPTQSTLHSNIS